MTDAARQEIIKLFANVGANYYTKWTFTDEELEDRLFVLQCVAMFNMQTHLYNDMLIQESSRVTSLIEARKEDKKQ